MRTETEFEEQEDGSVIAKLVHPITWREERDYGRVTIPALSGKHMRRVPYKYSEVPNIGQLCEFASSIVEPRGVFDELKPVDASAIALEVQSRFLRSLAIGEPSSP